jgi:hypothetical protein
MLGHRLYPSQTDSDAGVPTFSVSFHYFSFILYRSDDKSGLGRQPPEGIAQDTAHPCERKMGMLGEYLYVLNGTIFP